MDKSFYHYDSFELFGKKFHRIILIPDEPQFQQINSVIKQTGNNSDGFFWKKLLFCISKECNIALSEEFDFDAEKEACIVCIESKEALLDLFNCLCNVVSDQQSFLNFIQKIKTISTEDTEEEYDDLLG